MCSDRPSFLRPKSIDSERARVRTERRRPCWRTGGGLLVIEVDDLLEAEDDQVGLGVARGSEHVGDEAGVVRSDKRVGPLGAEVPRAHEDVERAIGAVLGLALDQVLVCVLSVLRAMRRPDRTTHRSSRADKRRPKGGPTDRDRR